MKESLVKEKGWKLLVSLFKEANKDGFITFDESRILRATDLNVSKLIGFVQNAWEDRLLTESEKTKITFLVKKIQDDAVSLAEYDDIITNEEEAMLNIIRGIIEEFFRDNYRY